MSKRSLILAAAARISGQLYYIESPSFFRGEWYTVRSIRNGAVMHNCQTLGQAERCSIRLGISRLRLGAIMAGLASENIELASA